MSYRPQVVSDPNDPNASFENLLSQNTDKLLDYAKIYLDTADQMKVLNCFKIHDTPKYEQRAPLYAHENPSQTVIHNYESDPIIKMNEDLARSILDILETRTSLSFDQHHRRELLKQRFSSSASVSKLLDSMQ
jgi:hypothetical protein